MKTIKNRYWLVRWWAREPFYSPQHLGRLIDPPSITYLKYGEMSQSPQLPYQTLLQI